MRSYDPTSEWAAEDLNFYKPEPWQLDMLKLNPSYVHWGPGEDYMWNDNGWTAPMYVDSWDEWELTLDDYNEVVHFYFHLHRDGERCRECGGCGLNDETKKLNDTFYDHLNHKRFRTDPGWCTTLTTDEVQMLLDEGRLNQLRRDPMPDIEDFTEEVNENPRVHGGINRTLLTRHRAKREGFYGECDYCDGHGHRFFPDAECALRATFWILHPRKGAARGAEVKEIRKEQVPEVLEFLREAHERNVERFRKAVEFANAFDDAEAAFDSLNQLPFETED